MKYISTDILFQEVPNEVSLVFYITGCPLRCKGCHSPILRSDKHGVELTNDAFIDAIDSYKEFITCVTFMGGDWEEDRLLELLKIVNTKYELKTCLFSGFCAVPECIVNELTYLKTGSYIEELGGLDSPSTNQRFFNVETWEDLTYLFQKGD